MTKKALSVAMRRNRHLREASEFCSHFSTAVGFSLSRDDLIPPNVSISIEDRLNAITEDDVSRSHVQRTSELDWTGVESRLAQYLDAMHVGVYQVFLCHYRDFAFYMHFKHFAAFAKRIVEFDGDSAYAVSQTLDHGFGIDMYTSEISRATRFTTDVW